MRGLWMPDSPIWRLAWLKRLSGGGGGEPVYKTVSGNPVTFSAVAAPLQALRVDFSPVQAGSGTPAPDNVRPISGRVDVKAHLARNENLFVNSGWEKASSTISAAGKPIAFEDADDAYTFYNIDNSLNCYVFAYDAAGNFVGRTAGAKRDHLTIQRTSFSSGDGTKNYEAIRSLMFRYYSVPSSITTEMIQASCRIMLLRGAYDESRQGSYTPGVVDSFTASFGSTGTVYGGYVDLISGELVVTHINVALSSLSWRLRNSAAPYIFSASFSDAYLTDGVAAEDQLCNLFPAKYVSGWSSAEAGYCNLYRYGPSTPSSDLVYLAFNDISTVEDLTAWLNSNNVHVCYRLKTPNSYQLSPQVIRTMRGSNTISTDGDTATVTYVEAWQ